MRRVRPSRILLAAAAVGALAPVRATAAQTPARAPAAARDTALASAVADTGVASPRALPTIYAAGRFYVRPITAAGDTLLFYTDTGGGLFLRPAAAVRLDAPRKVLAVSGEDTLFGTPMPPLAPGAWIPAPPPRGVLPVFEPPGATELFGDTVDGMLGQQWFGGRAWTFDYPGETLYVLPPGIGPAVAPEHRVPLAFRTDSAGARSLEFPRIRVLIDGDSLDLLFDTGATTFLTDSARAVLADGGAAERATSFITRGIYERWRKRHPDWRVITDAERGTGADAIQVPAMDVAGFVTGPVWFTTRPDANFHAFMARFMDRQVEGALGGSALRPFRITVDYPAATASFERPLGAAPDAETPRTDRPRGSTTDRRSRS